jgi:N-methylhydantoinase B
VATPTAEVTGDTHSRPANIARADVLRARLVSAVEEAEASLSATAYSSSVAEAQDFAAAIYTNDNELIAQTRRASGTFVGTLGHGMRTVLRHIAPSTLAPGDVLITNDPWIGGGHIPDVLSMRPVFWRGELVAFVGNIAHLSDLGGKPSADARDNFEEGFHIPPIHLVHEGRLNQDVLGFIGANSRLPKQVMGDVQAQSAANALMERRVRELLEDVGLATFRQQVKFVQDRAEAAMRSRLRALPDGVYSGVADSDGLGEPLRVAVAITVAGDSITADYTGSSPQSTFGLNVPFQLTVAETLYSLRVALAPDIPLVEGSMRPFAVTAPTPCVLNPLPPAPTMVRTIVVHNVCAAIWLALSPLVPDHIRPERLCAHFGGIWTFRFRGVARTAPAAYRHGGPPHASGSYTETYFSNGGMGALGNADGRHAVSMPVNCWNIPIEVMESKAPILFEQKCLVSDSGGAGTFRGGLGQEVRIRLLSDDPVDFIVGTVDRIDHPPFGLAGGGAGKAGLLAIDDVSVDRRRVHVLTNGQTVTARLPGGGGFGPPQRRSKDAVRRDVALGYVSAKAAISVYSVDRAAARR